MEHPDRLSAIRSVFISYGSGDVVETRRLTQALERTAGFDSWFDRQRIAGGDDFAGAINRALAGAEGFVAVFGRHPRGSYALLELNVALDLEVEVARAGGRFPVVPVVLPGHPVRDGQIDRSRWPPLVRTHHFVDLRAGYDTRGALKELVAALGAGQRPTRTEEGSPYPGLRPYRTDEKDQFFGREAEVEQVVHLVRSCRLAVLSGASGSGKSSLVRAGVLPRLAEPAPGEGPALRSLVFRAGASVTLPAQDADLPDVLVVDQLEDLLLNGARGSGEEVLAALVARSQYAWGGHVLLVVRADFLGELAESPHVGPLINGAHHVLSPLTGDSLRQVVEGPAFAAGVGLEPGLVERVLADCEGRPGVLPLLADSLRELWRSREGEILTLGVWENAVGGLGGPLVDRAESVWFGLEPAEQAVARSVWVRLAVRRGSGLLPVGRVRLLADLVPARVDVEFVRRVVDSFVRERLIVADDDGGGTAVAVAHDAVFHAWSRLRGWLAEEDADAPLLSALDVAAEEWRRGQREVGLLFRGSRHAAAVELRARRPEVLSTLEEEFVEAGDALAGEERRVGRAHVRRRRLLLAATTAMVVVAALASWALSERSRALEAEQTTAGLRLAAEARTHQDDRRDLALLLAAEAAHRDASAESRAALQDVLSASPLPQRVVRGAATSLHSLHVTSAGDTLIGRADGTVLFLDDGGVVGLSDQPVVAVGRTADGVTVGLDTEGWLRAAGERGPVTNLAELGPGGSSLDVSEDGSLVVAAAQESVVVVRGGEPVARWSVSPQQSRPLAAVAADGQTVVVTVDDQVLTGDLTAPQKNLQPLVTLATFARSLAVDEVSNRVVVGDAGGQVSIVDLGTRVVQPDRAAVAEGAIVALDVSPDGTLVAGLTHLGRLVVWDMASAAVLIGPALSLPTGSELQGGPGARASGQSLAVRFVDDSRLLSLGASALVRWDLSPAAGLTVARWQGLGAVVGLAASSDGPVVLRRDGTAVRAVEGSLVPFAEQVTALAVARAGVVTGHAAGAVVVGGAQAAVAPGEVHALAASPTADVVVASSGGSVMLLTGAPEASPVPLEIPLKATVTALAVSGDGSRVAAAVDGSRATEGPQVLVWRVGNSVRAERLVAQPEHRAPIDTLALGDDGTVVTGSDDRSVRVSRLAGSDAGPEQVLLGHEDGVSSLALDGTSLWSGGQDGEVLHWVLGDRGWVQLGSPVRLPPGRVLMTNDGDGSLLVAGGGAVHRWTVSTPGLVRQACALAGRAPADEELARYATGRAMVCSRTSG